uniref:LsmAD domain-containing protein n=1 Tax=Trichuris muris TaxID=70415 RepID=A0A5S6QM02_TRIMR
MPAEAKRMPQSCKEYAMSFVDFEDALTAGFTNHPLTHCLVCLMGSNVRIRTSDKLLYDGVLAGFTGNYDLGLRMVHPVLEEVDGDMVPTREECFERKVIPFSSVVSVQAVVDMENVTKNAFSSDSELSRLNGSTSERRLEKWESDVVEEELVLDESSPTQGWSAEEMFRKNELHFGVTTDYDDNLQQYNSVEVDKSAAEYKVKYAEAERLAKIIESNPASKRANDLENDDEERDIVQRPAGATNSTPSTLPTSMTSQGNLTYFRSNRSRGGSIMGGSDRGGRGGSGPRGGNYNQREIRSGSRTGAQQRDFDSGHHQSYQGKLGSSSRYHAQQMTPLTNSSQPNQQLSSRSVSTPTASSTTSGERNVENAHSAGNLSSVEDKRRNAYPQSKQNLMGPRAQTPVEGQQAQRRNQSHPTRGGYKDSASELRKFSQEYRLAENKAQTTHGSTSSSPTPRPSVITQHRAVPTRSAGRGGGEVTANAATQRQYSIGKDESPPHSSRVQVKQAEYRRTVKGVSQTQASDGRSLGDSGKNVSAETLHLASASSPEQQPTVERQTSSASSIKSVPLNPDAEEFRPQHMQSIVTQQPPALMQQQMLRTMNPANGTAFFPMGVPPNVAAAPPPGSSVLLNQNGAPQTMYPTPGSFSVQVYPGNPPLYNVQSSQAPVAILQNSSNLRPSPNGGGQHPLPVGAAPGNSGGAQPLMTAQTPVGIAQPPYLVQYTGPIPAGPQSNSSPFFLGQARVLHPPYMVPEAGANCGTMPQSVYALPPFLHVTPYGTPNPAMQQVIPGMQNPSHPPPGYAVASGVEPTNQHPTNTGNSAGVTGTPTNSTQTSAFAQPPTAAAAGTYPLAAAMPNQPLFLLPGNAYMAPTPTPIYANSNVVCTSATAPPGTPTQQPSGNGLIQLAAMPGQAAAAAAMYAAAGQAPFTPETGYMQFATSAQLPQNTYHQNLLRSSSVPAYGQGHPAQQAATAAGNAGVSGSNNGNT